MVMESPEYNLFRTGYGFRVVEHGGPMVRVTKYLEDGSKEVVERKASDEIPGCTPERNPLFAAAYKDGEWEVDLRAGCSRWHGPKSGRAVGRALRICGFTETEIGRAMRWARKLRGTCPFLY